MLSERFASHLLVLTLVSLLTACATREPARRLPPPPPATSAQIEKEMQYLQQAFLTDACLVDLRQAAPELRAGETQRGKVIYAVEFAPDARARDGQAYRLQVTERERLAWLHTGASAGGWYTVRGPLPLWSCMYRALP